MLNRVLNFINREELFNARSKLVLACSGGKDSMALLHFLEQHSFKFIVAHCNFKLRGEESDQDELVLKNYCKDKNLSFHSQEFAIVEYAKQKKLSIQEAARILRYDWLEQVRKQELADFVLTAHHLNDNLETMIYKLTKGSGYKGVRGILPKKDHLVRPFLETSLEEINAYVNVNQVKFREDSSNTCMKYSRNRIRHEIIPVLKKINPGLEITMLEHFERWRDMEKFQQVVIDHWRKKIIKRDGVNERISIQRIVKEQFSKTLMFELLRPYGFHATVLANLMLSLKTTESKQFYSKSHRILKDRKFLLITCLENVEKNTIFLLSEKKMKLKFPAGTLKIHPKPIKKLSRISAKTNYAYLDADKLVFPLTLRRWEQGDYFYPYGMHKKNGKPSKKKISKFLKDIKASAFEKEQVWVLCSGKKIVWVLGHRIDDRFSVSARTKNVMQMQLL